MKILEIRDIKIGEGRPKICVPIVGTNQDEIINQAMCLQNLPVDLIEWRIDWVNTVEQPETLVKMIHSLRKLIGNKPLLVTFRTAKEGGEKDVTDEKYIAIYEGLMQTGEVDLIDIELMLEEETVSHLVNLAHQYHVKVVMSNHDFYKTPEQAVIIERLLKMDACHADILKIAVMPQNSQDVLTLLNATEAMKRLTDQPVITMAMGKLGVITRLSGEIFGSAVTFGAVGKASAPGQIHVESLNQILDVLHLK